MLGQPAILRYWPGFSALWLAGVFFFESLDGLLFKELGEVLPIALLPPLLPPLLLTALIGALANQNRP